MTAYGSTFGSSDDFEDPAPQEFKIKLVFPLEGTKGFSTQKAYQYGTELIGAPGYTEEFEGKVEHFSYAVRNEHGVRSEACTWALEVVDPEERTWGLCYRFTHETNGVTFAVPFQEVLKKAVQGAMILALSKVPVPVPTLLSYPLGELDDEPTLFELGVWQEDRRRPFRQHLKELFLDKVERW